MESPSDDKYSVLLVYVVVVVLVVVVVVVVVVISGSCSTNSTLRFAFKTPSGFLNSKMYLKDLTNTKHFLVLTKLFISQLVNTVPFGKIQFTEMFVKVSHLL